MSKAFTKEQDSDLELDLDVSDPEEGESSKEIGPKNYMTPEGFLRLKDELRDLLSRQRPEVVRTVSWAASNGDRSENGDYIYGKRRLREIDRRIRFLNKRLDHAEIVDPSERSKDERRVLFGATVEFENEEGQRKAIRIVGIDETDPSKGDISWISPLAKALIGASVGDSVLFRAPGGEQELMIVSVRYERID